VPPVQSSAPPQSCHASTSASLSLAPPPTCHFDRSRPTLFFHLRSCEGVGLRSGEISLRSLAKVAGIPASQLSHEPGSSRFYLLLFRFVGVCPPRWVLPFSNNDRSKNRHRDPGQLLSLQRAGLGTTEAFASADFFSDSLFSFFRRTRTIFPSNSCCAPCSSPCR